MLAELEDALEVPEVGGRGVVVVERVPGVVAPEERLAVLEVVVLRRSEPDGEKIRVSSSGEGERRAGDRLIASVPLPCGRGGHGLTTEQVVGGRVVEEVEPLLLAVVDERRSRDLQADEPSARPLDAELGNESKEGGRTMSMPT